MSTRSAAAKTIWNKASKVAVVPAVQAYGEKVAWSAYAGFRVPGCGWMGCEIALSGASL